MRNYSIYTLKTKLEFTNLYQYLSEKDYKQLEQQILCHSYHTPICTWNGIVINGIEAYELFRKHSIPFRIKRLHFSSKEDVISWICTDQLKREDLTNINKKYLIGKKYDAEKILVSRQLSSTNKSHISGASIAAKKISEECNVEFLQALVRTRYSMMIGGATGSGKTTFLNALSAYIPKGERIITIEDNAELQIQGVENLVRLEAKEANLESGTEITIRDLIRAALRMRPDRVIIGEVRGAETFELLSALICTI